MASPHKPWKAEYAKSSRSSCKTCKSPIVKETFRLGKMVQATQFDGVMTTFSADDVEGLESLRWEDQEKVRKYVEGGGCGSSNAPTPAAMEYGVETSQTSRATCKHCNEKIMKGEVRISSKAEGQGARSLAWHHAKCFMEKSPVTQVDKLLGWDSLPASDQAVVCSLVKNSTVKVTKEEPLQESTSTTGAKRKKSSNNDQKSKLAKTEPDIVTKSSELESQLKAQSKALWALKDDLKKHVSTAELREMLECNDYVSTGSELDLRDGCADGMLFGALSVCPLCSGHLCYSEGKYKCHGYLSAWSKCSYSTIEPKRVDGKWKIPEEICLSTFIQLMKAAATEGQEANVVTDYVLKILGLEVCADTMVGDEMIRGISGGQKKRVTTGEMIVGPAKALFMDEISTGLDSSTTYSIVNSLKQYVHILKGTAVISLLQPAPETYNLFDDIILLSDGYLVYQGPREDILDFFESMGFRCPDRKGVADFLQEVTSKKDQQQYWIRRDEPYRFVKAKEFAEAYQSFHVGRRSAEELSVPYDKTKSHPAALTNEKYGIGSKQLLKVCTEREYLLMHRNSFAYVFKFCQLTIMALITMTLFFRTEMKKDTETDGGIYVGALFFAVVMIMFNGMSELPMTIYKLPVFYKQRDLLFFPPWAYALPSWILKVPVTFVEVGLWVFVTYYVMGFDPNVGRLFKQFLILIMANQMASSLFRFIAAVGRTMGVANTFGSFALLLQFALGGVVLSRDDVKKWWIWGYWTSPLMYAQNGILVNEFNGHSWRKPVANSNETLGARVVTSRGFFSDSKWYWIGLGALFGFTIAFNLCYSIALQFLNPFGKPQALISDDDDDKETVQSSTQQSTQAVGGNGISEAPETQKRGMVLPFEPHSLTFDNVVYSVDMPQEMRDQGASEDRLVLLKGVSGAFRPGVLTALMGVSGAGKTTLMDVLAGRKTGGYIDGDIKISGYPKKQETFARISGYCEQNDIHSPFVTIYEALVYSAWLRLPEDVDASTRKMFVDQVMELVELVPLRSALIGLPGVNGLSTEQRKRLTIAVELVANPSIIFMDEPTSGLDARAAAIVMRTVRNTVDTGRTVVCTIHQPSIDIFEAFDELFLMKRGGQEIYVGPLGRNSCHLIKYFESIDGVAKIKDGYNPATWMLEVTTSAQEMLLGMDFTDVYKNSDLYRRNKALISELSTPRPGSKDLYFRTQYSQSFWSQCMACLWKQHWSYWRNTSYTAVRFIFTTFIALAFGTMFWDLGTKVDRKQDVLNAMGSMYAAVLFLGVQNSSSVQPVVAVERTVFYREKAAGMYSALPYAFAQVVIEIPYILLQSAVYGVIVYAMIGFEWTAAKFFWYFFVMFFSLLYFTFYGMMSVAVTPNQNVASIVAAFFYGAWNLFSGFIIPRPSMPVWWRWYFWACPVSWTLYGLVASQFGDIESTLSDSDSGQTVKQFLEDYLGFKHDFLGVVAAVTVAFPVLFGFIFAYAIKAFNFQKR